MLAYHYLTADHRDAAAQVLQQLVAIKPNDTLSAQLLKQLTAPAPSPNGAPSASTPPAPATATTPNPVVSAPPPGATIAGTWTAQPTADTKVTLTIQPSGAFTWQVVKPAKTEQFAGISTFGANVLTLAQDNGPVLVGRLQWNGPNKMTFRVVGNNPDDHGLEFTK